MTKSPDNPLDLTDLTALSAWAPELAKTFVSLAGDIALVIDEAGVIRSVAQGSIDPIAPTAREWIGRPWVDTVGDDTRPKIENLLKDVSATGVARRREVNHLIGDDRSIPVAYTAIRLGEHGPVLAIGRDLRSIAAIQQRYVDSQQEMERGYWQLRQAEARYQLLFQVATDAVFVVDAEALRIVEANQAAANLFDTPTDQLQGRHAAFGFEHHSRAAVNDLLGKARSLGRGGEIRARLQGTLKAASIVATPFRTDAGMRLLVRVRNSAPDAPPETLTQTLARLVDSATDGVVVTDSSGRILVANRAFLGLARLTDEAQAKGRPLRTWLRLADQPLAALMAKVRRDGIAHYRESWLIADTPADLPVGICAALLTEGEQECIGFTIHPLDRSALPLDASDQCWTALRGSLELLAATLGERDLADLLRDAGARVEQHFIELALQRSAGALEPTAALLGISVAKLRQRLAARDAGTNAVTSRER